MQYRDNPAVAQNDSSLHRMALAWYARTVGWWISAPAPYVLLAIACALLAWRRRGDLRADCALAMATSGLLYVAPLPLVAPSAELRYSGWLFAAATMSLIALVAARRSGQPLIDDAARRANPARDRCADAGPRELQALPAARAGRRRLAISAATASQVASNASGVKPAPEGSQSPVRPLASV